MDEKETPLQLLNFLTDSLNVQLNVSAPTRNMFPYTPVDPYAKLCQKEPLEVLGEMSFGKPREVPEHVIGTPVQEFYRGKNIFITGGTGFLGKMLTEKLIRSIPNIRHIYLLIRNKRGKNCQERFQQLLEDQVFNRMKAEVVDYASKVSAVEGDISSPDLGLSLADRQMLSDSVHVVIHSAADVRFSEPLRFAINSNVYGAQRVLQLAKEMTNLKSYVHISTAYSQCVRRVVEEKVPKISVDYKELLDEIESKSDAQLEKETKRIILGWPNTYTFTKALCEDMLQEEARGLPFCIVRPSVVVTSLDEPVRGWTDNLYGCMGLMIGIYHGLLRCFLLDMEMELNVIPVDYVSNCTITAGRAAANHLHDDGPLVFNCVSNGMINLSWKKILESSTHRYFLWSFNRSIWYISLFTTTNRTVYDVMFKLLHKLPGWLIDNILQHFGSKPMLSKIYNLMESVQNDIIYFSSHIWEFKNDNVMKLRDNLSDEDRKLFNFDTRGIDMNKLTIFGKLGIRYYYLKESMETIPAAVQRSKWLYWLHNTTKIVIGLTVLKLLVLTARVLPF